MWLCGVYACDYGVVCAFSSLFQISLPCVNESECNVFPLNMDLNPRVLIWRVFVYLRAYVCVYVYIFCVYVYVYTYVHVKVNVIV